MTEWVPGNNDAVSDEAVRRLKRRLIGTAAGLLIGILVISLAVVVPSTIDLSPDQRLRAIIVTFVIVFGLAPPILFYFAHQQLRYQRLVWNAMSTATTDPATGMLNRFGFEKRLKKAISKFDMTGEPFALIMLDLDHFKGINDRHGHDAGDLVLKTVGERMTSLEYVLSVARIGGDEFALLIDAHPWRYRENDDVIFENTSRAMEFIFQPIKSGSLEFIVSGSAGLSIYSEDANSFFELRQHADAALLAAKRSGRAKLKIFNDEIDAVAVRRRELEQAIPVGHRSKHLEIAYQPIVCSASGRMFGAEVLARWQHPTLGFVDPPEFLSVAQECGFGYEINRNIYLLACRQAADWLKSGLLGYLSMNVSPLDLSTPDFATEFLAILQDHDIDPSKIWVEIIETIRVQDLETTLVNLDTLRAAGVRTALDDYGAGYSNIQSVLDLPLDRLKFDKSLVADFHKSTELYAYFRSTMQLAHSLGLDVVAEGVETESQLALVKAAGCKLVQGHLATKPLPYEDFDKLFSSPTEQSA